LRGRLQLFPPDSASHVTSRSLSVTIPKGPKPQTCNHQEMGTKSEVGCSKTKSRMTRICISRRKCGLKGMKMKL
uniref:Uncharacterized protein n=1 Tax=Oryzias sinensis TaxID=183150 RepID=A0A8C7XRA9_9TELE